MVIRKREQHWRQFAPRAIAEPGLDDRTQVCSDISLVTNNALSTPHANAGGARFNLQGQVHAIDQHGCAVLPRLRAPGHRDTPFALTGNPVATGMKKRLRITFHAPARQRDADRSVGQNAQNVASGPSMPHEQHSPALERGLVGQRQTELHGELRYRKKGLGPSALAG